MKKSLKVLLICLYLLFTAALFLLWINRQYSPDNAALFYVFEAYILASVILLDKFVLKFKLGIAMYVLAFLLVNAFVFIAFLFFAFYTTPGKSWLEYLGRDS